MRILAATAFVLFILTGCASRQMVEVPPPPEYAQEQQEMLRLALAQEDSTEFLKTAGWRIASRLELIQHDRAYRFIQMLNPQTNGVFGFLSRDDDLVALLSRERSSQLQTCLTPFNLDLKHWSDASFDSLVEKAEQYSILGDEEALLAVGTFRRYKDDSETAKTRRKVDTAIADGLTVAAYSPFLVIGVPFYLADLATGRPAESAPDYAALRSFAASLQLGQPLPDGDDAFASSLYFADDLLVTQLDDYDLAYSARDGRVIMIASPSSQQLYERQNEFGAAWYKRDDCHEYLLNEELM